MGKPRKKIATGQNTRGGGGGRGRGRGHKLQGNHEKEELWEQMERTNLQSDETDSEEEEEEEEEEELRAPFPVGMWDLLQCDPKGELMINPSTELIVKSKLYKV